MAVHERAWEQGKPWQPMATWVLLGVMVVVYLLEQFAWNGRIWLIWTDWPTRPWSLITSTLAHGGQGHLLINGLMLFFFGPVLERAIGWRAYVALFLIGGAASGVLQVELSAAFGNNYPALGASGALMLVFGVLVVLMPNERVFLMGFVPVPFWGAAILYAGLDLLGAFNPNDGVGNFAHLAGLALGLSYGYGLRQRAMTRYRGGI